MAVLRVNHEAGTFTHACSRCGHERDLSLDPAVGDIHVHPKCFTIPPCPACAGWIDIHSGEPTFMWHYLVRDIPAWHAHEAPHPGSLIGQVTRLEGGLEGVVVEHLHGQHPPGHPAVKEARLIREMQRHPLLAKHAPLREKSRTTPSTGQTPQTAQTDTGQ